MCCQLGLVSISREEQVLDVVLALWRVAWLQELQELPEALIFHDGHWLQVSHNHLDYGLSD